MIKAIISISIPAVIISFAYLIMRIKVKGDSSISSHTIISGQSRLCGFILVAAPAFTACMGLVCLLLCENISLLMLGAEISLLSITLFLTGSVIISLMSDMKRNKDYI